MVAHIQGPEELPWDDLKVAIGCEDTDAVWRADENGSLVLPDGWILCETCISGAAGYLAIFRVECLPTVEAGLLVRAAIAKAEGRS